MKNNRINSAIHQQVISDNPRKKRIRIGTIQPRNHTEQVWLDRFGSVTPIPDLTMRRKPSYITAAILFIHFNQPLERIAKLTNCQNEYLKTVSMEDKWAEFAQQLSQITKPSNLSIALQHDYVAVEEELRRRKSSVAELRAKEQAIMDKLKSLPVGSLAESTALGNIKKIRDLIERALSVDDYLAELHAARKVVLTAQARAATGDLPEEMRQVDKGQVLDLKTETT